MKRPSLFLLVSLAVIICIGSSFENRSALGLVVETCKINSRVTGSPYPCLKVVQSKDQLSSYAVVREPGQKERTVFVPLADIPGVEDPRLLKAGVPNYFELAWEERAAAVNLRAEGGNPVDFALAINAATWRTQDRLHIHVGCATSRFRAVLRSHSSDISNAQFRPLLNNVGWWVRFYAAADLSTLNPIQAVADGLSGARSNMKNVVIGVFRSETFSSSPGFYVLARVIGASKTTGSAEDMIDPTCRSEK